MKLLLATDGIDVNKGLDGCSDLCIASCRGHVEVVKHLLAKAGIEMTMSLYGASQNGRTDVVKALLENAKADVDASLPNGTTVLIAASGGGRTEIVKMLLDVGGIDVEKKTEDGLTALAVAKKYQNADIIALLKPNTSKKRSCEEMLAVALSPADSGLGVCECFAYLFVSTQLHYNILIRLASLARPQHSRLS